MIEIDGRKWYAQDDLECYTVGFEKYRLMKKLKSAVYEYILDHTDYPDGLFIPTRLAKEMGLGPDDRILTVPIFISPYMKDNEIYIVKAKTETPPEARVRIGTWPGVDEVNPKHHLINSISITA